MRFTEPPRGFWPSTPTCNRRTVMPVVRGSDGPSWADIRGDLIARLAKELGVTERTGEEPLIFENPIQRSGFFSAMVIWSAWRQVPWSQRAGIITDAYRAYDQLHPEAAPRAPHLATASGFTWEEADLSAVFPFSVEPNVREGEAD